MTMNSPSEELVEIISPLLVARKLFLPDDASKYKGKIAAGTMNAEDWMMAIEKAWTKETDQ